MTEKSPEAFRTISEVAEELDLPQHVLRFWETRFAQIKPMKRGGGRRYYRPEDINLLKGIRFLLYDEGYTIKGVQRILKEQGVRHVGAVWDGRDRGAPESPPSAAPPQDGLPAADPAPREARESAPAPVPASPRAAAPPPAPASEFAPTRHAPSAPADRLSQEEVRQLKAALFELIECKQLIDSTLSRGESVS